MTRTVRPAVSAPARAAAVVAAAAVAVVALFPAPAMARPVATDEFIGARVGFERIDADLMTRVELGARFRIQAADIGLHLPLRMRLWDAAPREATPTPGIRKLDWDEASDWGRFVRFVRVGDRGDPVIVRVGRLDGVTLGHGTILDAYYNTLQTSHYRTGLRADVDLGRGGGQVFVNDLVAWQVTGLRGFVRPLRWPRDAPSWARDITLGATLVVDRNAPRDALVDADGAPRFDAAENLEMTMRPVVAWGLEVSWPFLVGGGVTLAPYADYNVLDVDNGFGTGVHVGGLVRVEHAPSKLSVELRYALRRYADGYLPRYFDASYEIDRRWLRPDPSWAPVPDRCTAPEPGLCRPVGKARYARAVAETAGVGTGHLVRLGVRLRALEAGGLVDLASEAAGGRVLAWLRWPTPWHVDVDVRWGKRLLADVADVFSADDAWGAASVRYRFGGGLFAEALWLRQWHARGVGTLDGGYHTTHDLGLRAGVAFAL
jgi:hypothetical protein